MRTFLAAGALIAVLGLAVPTAPASAQPVFAPRPPGPYLHGPFASLHIALEYRNRENGGIRAWVVHVTVRDPAAIRRLVHAMNHARRVGFVLMPCPGGGVLRGVIPGPAWLSFVRGDGHVVHAWQTSPCGGYGVNSADWLEHSDALIWSMILSLVGGRG